MSLEVQLKVPLASLQNYLLREGWRRIAHPNRRLACFERGDADLKSSVVLPADSTVGNADSMIEIALRNIAEAMASEPFALASEIAAWSCDILKLRLFDPDKSLDRISLNSATEVLGGLKRFIGYSAYTQINPKPFFDKAGSAASDFTEKCLFGHTFKGSFGLSVECPFEYSAPLLPMDDNPPDLPFERQVMERIATGLDLLREATLADSVDLLVDGYDQGLNANALTALKEIYDKAGGARLEFDLAWGAQLRSEMQTRWKPFVFGGAAADISERAVAALNTVVDEPEWTIAGHVTLLRSEEPLSDENLARFPRAITMWWERQKNLRVKIRVPLQPAQYKLACDAHRDSRKIMVRGIPKKKGKSWSLTGVSEFRVL